MASPMVSSAFADLLDPRFREVSKGTYDKGTSRIGDIFSIETSAKNEEKYSQVTPMGKFQTFTGAIGYDGIEQGYDVTGTHVEKVLGMQIQRKLYDDAQFDTLDDMYGALGDSAFKTHEDDAVQLYAGAFSAVNAFFSHSEGVAMCSSAHTCPRSGVSTASGFSNYGTSAFSKTSLTAAIIQFRQFKDDGGDVIDESPDELIIPVNLEDAAKEVLQTPWGLDAAEGTINVHQGRLKLVVFPRLSDVNDWFLSNAALRKKNQIWFWRVKPEFSKMESFDNIIAKSRGYMRYSYLRRDWRHIFGSNVG